MEKGRHAVQIGEMLLPVGFRFRPTDEEVVVHYLKRKVFSLPLPASVIPELDVYQNNPWDLPGELKEKRFFFTKRKGNANKSSSSFCAGSGYWKLTGKDKRVLGTGNKQIVGMKRLLVFYKGERPHGLKTHWVMDQFYLVGCETNSTPNSTQIFMMPMEDWVVCCIHEKESKGKNYGMVKSHLQSRKNRTRSEEMIKPSLEELMMMEDSTEVGPSSLHPSSSTCSSGITEVSSDECYQEANSAYKLLSYPCTGKQ